MKMKKLRQNGFVLILVITAIALIGTWMFVLTGDSNVIMFQSDAAYLAAANRNLIASGLAWAEQQIQNENREIFDRTVELDVTNMKSPQATGSTLTVTIAIPTDKQAEVQINTSCSCARQTLTRSLSF